MPEQVPQELIDRIVETLTSPSHRIDDIYVSEQRELEEPETPHKDNGHSPQGVASAIPTGIRRFSLYMRYVVIEEEKAYKSQQREEEA